MAGSDIFTLRLSFAGFLSCPMFVSLFPYNNLFDIPSIIVRLVCDWNAIGVRLVIPTLSHNNRTPIAIPSGAIRYIIEGT